MTDQFRAAGAAVSSASAATLAPVVPAGAQVGDLLVLSITVTTALAQTFTGLTGWTQQKNLNVNSPVLAVFTKFAASADIGATLAPAWTTTAACAAGVLAYVGVGSTTPVEASASSNNTGSSTVNYGNATQPTPDLVLAIGAVASAVTVGTPSGHTQRFTNSTNVGLAAAERSLGTAGATGAVTSTAGGSANSEGVLLCLRPSQSPVIRAVGSGATATTATTLAVSSPASTQIGDLLVASVGTSGTTTVWNTPAGWTLVGQNNGCAIFYKFATLAGAQSTSFTISTTAANLGGVIDAYAGGVVVEATASAALAATNAAVFPSVTTLGTDRVLLCVGAWNNVASSGGTPPVGMAAQDNSSRTNMRSFLADETTSTGVTTGTRSMTIGGSATSGTLATLALAPSSARPKIRAAAKGTVSAGTSLSVTLPAVTVSGDAMVMTVAWATTPGTVTGPSGWTEIESDLTGTNGEWFKAYLKTAGVSEANPSVSWTSAATGTAGLVVIVGSGILDVDGHTITAASATVNWPSVTTVGTADTVLFFAHTDAATGPLVTPVGSTVLLTDMTVGGTAITFEFVNGAVATGARTATVVSGTPDNTGYAVALYTNSAPNASTLTAPIGSTTIDRTVNNNFTWLFSDPDAGDTQSAADLRYRLVGAGAWTTISGAATTAGLYTMLANTLAAGNYEWQELSYDSHGAAGTWSTSSFFTAASPPTTPTITSPATGTTIATATQAIVWSASQQDSYEVRRVADIAGSPDTSTVYFDPGEVVDAASRTVTLSFPTNNRTEHVEVRVKFNGLWSSWADARYPIAYTSPASPTCVVAPSSTDMVITVTNPVPGGGQPAIDHNEVWRRVTGTTTATRLSVSVANNGTFTDSFITSGQAYEYQIVAVATTGATASSAWTA